MGENHGQAMFHFITICVGSYAMEYANKSFSMMKRHAGMSFTPHCITDRPDQLDPAIHPITPSMEVTGWWNKMLAFGPDMPEGWIVVMDVDLLILQSIRQELEYGFAHVKEIGAYSDAIHWMGCKFSSSFMIFRSGELAHVYENFRQNYAQIEDHPGGDQVWLGPQLKDVCYLDEAFPNFKRSLKFDLSKIDGHMLTIPNELSADIKIVDFHGRPKPHEITHVPFVRDHWK